MKSNLKVNIFTRLLLPLVLTTGLALPLSVWSAPVSLATSPLATSTTSSVKPNLIYIFDDSGSMGRSYMPDVARNFDGRYGYASNQCNGVYYDPSLSYNPPVYASGASYPDSKFTSAWNNGFNTGSGTTNLSSNFTPPSGSFSSQTAFYYQYSGAYTAIADKDYYNSSSPFYKECTSNIGNSYSSDVFTKVILSNSATATTAAITVNGSISTKIAGILLDGEQIMSSATASTTSAATLASDIANRINICATAKVGNCSITGGHGYTATSSGGKVLISGLADNASTLILDKSGGMTIERAITQKADATKLTNFANWYSYYHTRLLMMKTSSGHAFSNIDTNFRVGYSTINYTGTSSTSSEFLTLDAFNYVGDGSGHKEIWYDKLYSTTAGGGTPLRAALSKAGRLYAGKLLTGSKDPVQYSCQQNFTILSTDGYWNSANGYKLDGSTPVGDQDGLYPRPYNDGASSTVTETSTWDETQTTVARTTQDSVDTTSTFVETGITHLDNLQEQEVYTGGGTTVGTPISNKSVKRPKKNCTVCTVEIKTTKNHGFVTGDTVEISGIVVKSGRINNYNGTFVITKLSKNKFSYVSPSPRSAKPKNKGTGSKKFGTSAIVGSGWSSTAGCAAGEGRYTIQPQRFNSYTNQLSTVTTTTVTTNTQQTDSTTEITTPFKRVVTKTNGVITSDVTTSGKSNTVITPVSTITAGTPVVTVTGPVTSTTVTQDPPADFGPSTLSACVTSVPPSPSTPVVVTTFPPSPAGDTVVAGPVTNVSGFPQLGVLGAPSAPITLSGPTTTTTPVVNQPTVSTSSGGVKDTLADAAMYYYQTDLRTTALGNCTGSIAGEDLCNNNVFLSGKDNNSQQHMTTFTLGLGASGRMKYSASYQTDTPSSCATAGIACDYHSIWSPKPPTAGYTLADQSASPPVCSWQGTGSICNWPVPGSNRIENIDDMWHAAVNGRGVYFSATDPKSLSSGLANALFGIKARKGSSAAAATSTLNPVAGNNFAYVASYTTVLWTGNLEARGININNGAVNENASWCVENVPAGSCAAPSSVISDTSGATTAYFCSTPNTLSCQNGTLIGTDCVVPLATACTGTMPSMVSAASDGRTILTADSAGTGLTDFLYANLTATQKGYFSAANISGLTQWPTFSAAQQTTAEGANLVKFLRGQTAFEDRTSNLPVDRLYRLREATLGDALESQPSYIGKPVFKYPYPGYSDYLAAEVGRAGTVYMGANDGMMHAFDAASGVERWAYVPSMAMSNMWGLADGSYSTKHINYVNGSPTTSDICIANCNNDAYATTATTSDDPVWKTILVGGLNAGGRGYYALDITNPASPALLWEFSPTGGHGKIQDNDIGYSYGQPVITRKTDGTWVVLVTSGHNNTSPGDGKGYLYVLDAANGTILSKISTGVGGTATPSGLAKIAGWNNEPGGNEVGYVYGGDLLGNVWRFDVNDTATSAAIGTGSSFLFATLFSDAAGTNPQPITTTPVLGKILEKRVIYIGTGQYLGKPDLSTTQSQTQYAIMDDDATVTFVNPRNSMVQQTLIPVPANSTRTSSGNAVDFGVKRGWFVDFPDTGERVNIDSKLILGALLVPTIVPSNTTCSPGGTGWLNAFDYKTGTAVKTVASLKYDSPIVGVNIIYIKGDPIVEVVTSANPTPTIEAGVAFQNSSATFTSKRMIRRELIE